MQASAPLKIKACFRLDRPVNECTYCIVNFCYDAGAQTSLEISTTFSLQICHTKMSETWKPCERNCQPKPNLIAINYKTWIFRVSSFHALDDGTKESKWFHSSWPVSNAQLLKLLQRPQSSRIKSLLGHSQFSLGPAHSLRYAVGHRDPLTRWANVSKCEQTQIMTRLTKNNTIFDIEI